MPKGKKNSDSNSVAQIIEKFSTGLRDDLSKLYQMGFAHGAEAERKRMAAVFMSGAAKGSQVSPKSDPVAKAPAVKKLRKNPWASYTPEQKAARLANLAAAREKGRAAKAGAVITVDPAVPEAERTLVIAE